MLPLLIRMHPNLVVQAGKCRVVRVMACQPLLASFGKATSSCGQHRQHGHLVNDGASVDSSC